MLKKAQWLEIKRLHAEGLSKRAIALRLAIDRRTAASALRKDVFPTRPANARIASTVEPYREFVLERLAEYPELGAMSLCRKLMDMGHPVGYSAVKRFVRRIRGPVKRRWNAVGVSKASVRKRAPQWKIPGPGMFAELVPQPSGEK